MERVLCILSHRRVRYPRARSRVGNLAHPKCSQCQAPVALNVIIELYGQQEEVVRNLTQVEQEINKNVAKVSLGEQARLVKLLKTIRSPVLAPPQNIMATIWLPSQASTQLPGPAISDPRLSRYLGSHPLSGAEPVISGLVRMEEGKEELARLPHDQVLTLTRDFTHIRRVSKAFSYYRAIGYRYLEQLLIKGPDYLAAFIFL